MKIDLNCDLGEGFNNEEAIMPYITSANIACGFHAGNEMIMRSTVRLAKRFGVNVGAHPGWKDMRNFGRQEVQTQPEEVEALVLYQIGALAAIARAEGLGLRHVKPHGALYNQAAKDRHLADAIARAVKSFSTELILVGLTGSRLCEAGLEMGLIVAAEGFPDRGYHPDGTLLPRNLPGALIESPEEVTAHALDLVRSGKTDTLCLHGDHPNAAENARLLREVLWKNNVNVVGI